MELDTIRIGNLFSQTPTGDFGSTCLYSQIVFDSIGDRVPVFKREIDEYALRALISLAMCRNPPSIYLDMKQGGVRHKARRRSFVPVSTEIHFSSSEHTAATFGSSSRGPKIYPFRMSPTTPVVSASQVGIKSLGHRGERVARTLTVEKVSAHKATTVLDGSAQNAASFIQ